MNIGSRDIHGSDKVLKKITCLTIIFGLILVTGLPTILYCNVVVSDVEGASGGPGAFSNGDLTVNDGSTTVIENYPASNPYGQKGDILVEGKKYTALPATAGGSDNTGEPIADFQNPSEAYTVGATKTMYIDTFDTTAFNTLASDKIGAVMLMVRYSTGGNASTGYAGSNSVQWALQGETLAATTITPYNTTGNNVTSYYSLFPAVNSVAKAQTLDVQFINNDPTYNVFVFELELQVYERSTLEIRNSTFMISMDTSHIYTIDVMNGGLLILENSTLTVDVTQSSPYFNLDVDVTYANFEIKDSSLIFPGAVTVMDGNFSCVRSEIIALASPHNTKGCAVLDFDSGNIYFEESKVNNYLTGSDISLSGSTKFIGINTYLDIDFYTNCVFQVTGSSQVYFYNVTIDPPFYPPFSTAINVGGASAEVKIYRWLTVAVLDCINVPIGNAKVDVEFSNGTTPEPPIAEVLNYMGKTGSDYYTDNTGSVTIPALSDILDSSTMPNSDFVGNYKLTATHNLTSMGSINVGLPIYPHIEKADNNPATNISSSTVLISPEDNSYYQASTSDIVVTTGTSTIKNSIYKVPSGGTIYTYSRGQKGNIIVGGTGTLIIQDSFVGLEQDANYKFYILVKESGTLYLQNGTIQDGIVSPQTVPINIYLFDNATLKLNQNSMLNDVGALAARARSAADLINLEIANSTVYGNILEATGSEINVDISSDSMIDVGSLILDNANVKIIDTIVTTTTQPSFNGANFTAIDASFNRDLSFSTPYNVTLINVNEPQFFNITAMGSTMVYVYWWLTVRVKDSRANPLPEAEVYIWNYTATMEKYHIPYRNGTTGLNGEVTFDVLCGYIDSTGYWYGGNIGNYYINATYLGVSSEDTGYVFGSNQEIEIVITGAPDLVIQLDDIDHDPNEPFVDEIVNITVTVHNTGQFGASNIYVSFYDLTAGQQIGVDQHIPLIEASSNAPIMIQWVPTFAADHVIKISADPGNLIGESFESNNNVTSYKIKVNPQPTYPDLIVEEIDSKPEKPADKNWATLNATIHNKGNNIVGEPFMVQFYEGDPNDNGKQIDEDQTINFVDIDGSVNVEVQWYASGVGEHEIYVVIDPLDLIEEINENNNIFKRNITVVEGADLVILEDDITTEPSSPITRETPFGIKATVHNEGGSSASNIMVRFYLDSFENPIGDRNITYIEEGSSGSAHLQWVINQRGPRQILVKVDPEGVISDINPKNNWNKTNILIVNKADLEVQSKDILLSKTPVPNSENVTISAKVRNSGETDAYDVTVRFFSIPKGSEVQTQIGGDISIALFKYGESYIRNISVVWYIDAGGDYSIVVKVIPDYEGDDENMNNNEATRKDVYVQQKADLYIDSEEIEILPKDVIGAYQEFTINATVYNNGDSTVYDVIIRFYGREPAVGGKPFYEEQINKFTGGGTKKELQFIGIASIIPLEEGTHTIYIVADPLNSINEEHEDNNVGTIELTIKSMEADLTFPSAEYFKINDEFVEEDQSLIFKNGSIIDMNITLYNQGFLNAINFSVEIYDGLPEQNGVRIFNTTIAKLGTTTDTEKMNIYVTGWKPGWGGDHEIVVILNEDKLFLPTINETNYDNNRANITITVLNSDLVTWAEEITLYRDDGTIIDLSYLLLGQVSIVEGEDIKINTRVKNNGESTEDTVQITFFKGNPDTDGDDVLDTGYDELVISTLTRSINPKGEQIVNVTWLGEDEKEGTFRIYVWIDPSNTITESNENNNLVGMSDSFTRKAVKTEDKDEDAISMMMIMMIIIIIVVIVIIAVVVYYMVVVKKRRETMAECSECGNLMPLDAGVCPKCGAEFTDEIECGECGALMSVEDAKCPECGAEFKKLEEGEMEEKDKDIKEPPEGAGKKGEAPAAAPPGKKPSKEAAVPAIKGKKAAPVAPAAPSPPPPAAPAAAAAAEGEEEMIECYQCGATVPLSAPMCPECGAEFE